MQAELSLEDILLILTLLKKSRRIKRKVGVAAKNYTTDQLVKKFEKLSWQREEAKA